MHNPYILNIKNAEAQDIKTEKDAEAFTYSWLSEEGFCNSGFYGSGKAEWFQVGGRFSTLLGGKSIVRYNGEKEFVKICKELANDNYDYIDTDYEEGVKLEKGDWLVVVDYHD